jgi:hypothetical protein
MVRPERGDLVWARSFRGDLSALFEIEETISQWRHGRAAIWTA